MFLQDMPKGEEEVAAAGRGPSGQEILREGMGDLSNRRRVNFETWLPPH